MIVDDADHLSVEELEVLIHRAGEKNIKVLLAVSSEAAAGPNRSLVDSLVENLPWGIALGTAAGRESTAMQRVTEHLAGGDRRQADGVRTAQALIARRGRLVESYRELAAPKRWRTARTESVERNVGLGL